jgi:hypothetical protein
MRRIATALMLVTLLLAACSRSGDVELTLVSENVALNTQMSEVRASATAAADQLQITLEYVQTAITEVARKNQILSATLVAAGLNPDDIAALSPQPVTLFPTPLPNALASTPLDLQATEEPGAAPLTPAANPPLDASPAAPALINGVMAEGVGSNDCALAAVSAFRASIERIYVVATAVNIAPGTTLTSRWYREGAQIVRHDFTPDFAIQQACIWFYIDQGDTAFTPGNYSVQLEINGSVSGPSLPFTIVE